MLKNENNHYRREINPQLCKRNTTFEVIKKEAKVLENHKFISEILIRCLLIFLYL